MKLFSQGPPHTKGFTVDCAQCKSFCFDPIFFMSLLRMTAHVISTHLLFQSQQEGLYTRLVMCENDHWAKHNNPCKSLQKNTILLARIFFMQSSGRCFLERVPLLCLTSRSAIQRRVIPITFRPRNKPTKCRLLFFGKRQILNTHKWFAKVIHVVTRRGL